MLKTKKTINVTGDSMINDAQAQRFTCLIDESNLDATAVTSRVKDEAVYLEHIEECRMDQAEFQTEIDQIVRELREKEGKVEEVEEMEEEEGEDEK